MPRRRARHAVAVPFLALLAWLELGGAGCSGGRVPGVGQCGTDSTCAPGRVCLQDRCVDLDVACADGVRDGDETGVDCGGSCAPCAVDGTSCTSGEECTSGVCDVICQAPTCSDGVRNGQETGIDCGGSCVACGTDGAPCASPSECQSEVCDATCQVPSCSDGVQNGDETGIDCGGSCVGCDGELCGAPSQCASGVCDVTCQGASCSDGVQNGDETSVDCGGTCGACDGAACTVPSDCASDVCEVTCQVPSCSDEVQNGDETGIDCGGTCVACDGEACSDPSQCASGVCEILCLEPSCSDGVRNGGETDEDCGGSCPGCADGSVCLLGSDCLSATCIDGLCWPAHCASDAQDFDETGVDCGGSCPGCPAGTGCTDGSECASGVCDAGTCAEPACDDHVKNGDETDVDCGGLACLACLDGSACESGADCASAICGVGDLCAVPPCACLAVGCGDGVIDDPEACDNAGTLAMDDDVLGALSCTTLGYDGGVLGCNADCSAPDTSQCTGCVPSCTGDAICVGSTCQCPQGTTDCSGTCVTTTTDPANCGGCGVACDPTQVCSAGACVGECQDPLVACDGRCVDTLSDNRYCSSTGLDCGLPCDAGQVCNNGACVTPLAVLEPLPKCVGSGPPIELDVLPGNIDCAGNLASVTFRWGVCTCNDLTINQGLVTDGFDSNDGPYDPASPGTGAGAGTNGAFTVAGPTGTVVHGTLWAAGQTAAPTVVSGKQMIVDQGLYCGGPMTVAGGAFTVAGTSYVSALAGDAHVDGSIGVNGVSSITLTGDLFQTPAMSLDPKFVVNGEYDGTTAVTVAPPCDCSPDQLIDVAAIVAAHACTGAGVTGCAGDANDNEAAGLDPDILLSGGGRLDLDCGHYYFSAITPGLDTTIHAHGNVAIYVGGTIAAGHQLTITLDPTAQLDMFVAGALCGTQPVRIGSANYPALTRVYVGDPDVTPPVCPGATVPSSIVLNQVADLAGNFYAPYFPTTSAQPILLYGGLFTREILGSQPITVHFDRAVVSVGEVCSTCGDGAIGAGEECDGTLLGGRTCVSLEYTGGQLGCYAPGAANECQLDERGCCGDGTAYGAEPCDDHGTSDPTDDDLRGLTCQSLGFESGTLACTASCTLDTSGCTVSSCNRDALLSATEVCDDAGTPDPSDDLLGEATCQSLGFDGGVLACGPDCLLDTSGCTRCGDGVLDEGEQCDATQLGVATCESLGFPAGTLACAANCTYDTSGCGGCTSCRDCNNQACIDGQCTSCVTDLDCCAPLLCAWGACVLY